MYRGGELRRLMVSGTVAMIPGLVSRMLHSCLLKHHNRQLDKKNAPHLMAESGAWVPVCQILKVVVMTKALVTWIRGLHYPCQQRHDYRRALHPLPSGGMHDLRPIKDTSAELIIFYTG